MNTPPKLKGTGLEKELLHVIKSSDEITGGRYGVMTSVKPDGELIRIKSYPDIEGVRKPVGQQFNVECKVCSQASLHLATRITDDKQSKQLAHLLRRAEFGGVSMYLVHFNRRELKTKTVEQRTFAFPVHPCHPFWLRFLGGFESKVNIEICQEHAVPIEWIIPNRCRKARPNFVPVIEEVDNLIMPHRQKQSTTWLESPIFNVVG